MSWKKEPCRNFQRGSCHYGDRCKFLHVTQSESKPNPFGFGTGTIAQSLHTSQQKQQSNPFGFGAMSGAPQQRQQQQPNIFGFGVQSSSHSGSGYQSNYQKPFENKWTRTANSSKKTDSQPRTVSHKCEDPNACKQLIVEDLTNERPLWKLTCYGHFKGLCDIYGDTSYEELRAAAYDDASRGLNLQSIVERERNLLNSKLLEFDKLLQSPYVVSQTYTTTVAATFSQQNISPLSAQAFEASSFGQPRPSAAFSTISVHQSSPFQNLSQIAIGNDPGHGTSGLFGEHFSKQLPGTFGSNINFGAAQNRTVSAFSSSTISEPFSVHDMSGTAGGSFSLTAAASVGNKPIDASIWLKEKWAVKEIPEEEPPSRFCQD